MNTIMCVIWDIVKFKDGLYILYYEAEKPHEMLLMTAALQ